MPTPPKINYRLIFPKTRDQTLIKLGTLRRYFLISTCVTKKYVAHQQNKFLARGTIHL